MYVSFGGCFGGGFIECFGLNSSVSWMLFLDDISQPRTMEDFIMEWLVDWLSECVESWVRVQEMMKGYPSPWFKLSVMQRVSVQGDSLLVMKMRIMQNSEWNPSRVCFFTLSCLSHTCFCDTCLVFFRIVTANMYPLLSMMIFWRFMWMTKLSLCAWTICPFSSSTWNVLQHHSMRRSMLSFVRCIIMLRRSFCFAFLSLILIPVCSV